ncbi:hypothetical protein FE633_11845 [Streptomyces montanus]|uniref:Uncharacterized protein n=1 Tax=Streptomyces montanus TaxID=2580423 RepID=A0A5R9FT62_9ACTN|nr:hypothetical protein [Streptomyces montanus]TLS45849.1 hypothetical protein FE633_11845 [Streptomyces montanus]
MPLFRRADWPGDHRDEAVAGVLVGAVVIVLGYASGIGAPNAPGSAQAAVPPTSPPAATAPPSQAPPGAAPGAVQPGGQVPAGTGQLPVGGVELPIDGGSGGHAGHGSTGGGSGHGHDGMDTPAPSPSHSTSPERPDGSPGSSDADCEDGEVRLLKPLLTGIAGFGGQLLGLVGGTDAANAGAADDTSTPEPGPSPCVGLATPTVTP